MKFGESLPKRRALIERLAKKTTPPETYPIDFQNDRKYLPVYSVSIDFPRYRLANGRTGVDQVEYLAKHPSLPKDLFQKPESDLAQKHQHEILKGMIDEADLKTYFKHNRQIDPLILDSEGFVVNGNRRLCAMREFYYSKEKNKFRHFSNIDVVFLPPSDQAAILELENRLQILKDIKSGYKWYNTAYLFKRRLAEGMEAEEVQDLYEVSPKEFNHSLAMYDEAEKYLAARNIPGKFSEIPNSKFAFDELVKALKIVDEKQKDSFLSLAYLVIEKPEGRRAYDQIPKIARDLETILPLISTVSKTKESKGAKSAARKLLGKKGTKNDKMTILIPKLDAAKERDAARLAILNAIGEEDSRRREHKKGDFVRSQIERAETSLGSALDQLHTAKDKKTLPQLLAKVQKTLDRLKRAVKR